MSRLTDADARALVTYLRSIAPVRHEVGESTQTVTQQAVAITCNRVDSRRNYSARLPSLAGLRGPLATRQQLIAVLHERCDGFWELLATAAGRTDSVQRSMDGLAAKALDLHHAGPSVSPSLVEQRIEALAAFDPTLVLEVSRSWKLPEQISPDPMDAAADFWLCAWSSAMRFLGNRVPRGSKPLPYMVQLEWDVLFGPPPTALTSFDALLAFVTNEDHRNYRRLDRGTVELEEPLSQRQLVELLGNQPDVGRLRVLLPRLHLFGPDARAWLEQLLRDRWLTLREPPRPWSDGGLLTLVNIVLDLAGEEPPADITEQFITMLRRSPEPAAWAPFGYVLLRQGWSVP